MSLIKRSVFALMFACLTAACGASDPPRTAGSEPISQPVQRPEPVPNELTEAAAEMKERILAVTKRDSLRGFANLADEMPGFASNFDGVDHYQHWFLLRRTGIDPLLKIEDLFELPFGVREVGDEYWFIWPDFAAMEAEDLVPEKLSFQDRVRLQELIGEDGLEGLRSGGLFPGLRTAINDSGRWIYYVNDIGESEAPSP